MLLNSVFVDPLHEGHRHPCFFGTAAEVLEDCSGDKNAAAWEDEDEKKKDSNFVRGPLKWLTVDPGQQTVGSFHPITTGEWSEGVHLSNATGRLVELSQDHSMTTEAMTAAVDAITPT